MNNFYDSLFVSCPRVGGKKMLKETCYGCHYFDKVYGCLYREMYNPLNIERE